jgi:RimJ/RimL family protein N-acetyltransferase
VATDAIELRTARLRIALLGEQDAPFMLRLLNDADFLANVGDRRVRTIEDARAYIMTGPVAAYRVRGFGMFGVRSADGGEPLGIATLLDRETLPAPDLGFAYLPEHRRLGYAFEASEALIDHARSACRVTRLLAIAKDSNAPSHRVLEKLGFHRDGMTKSGDEELALFARWL